MANKKKAAAANPVHMDALMASVPQEHQDNLTAAIGQAPGNVQGPIIDILTSLRAALAKMGTIPWGQLIALVPLIVAAFANPLTGIGPLVLAIIALFNPAPAPVAHHN